MRAQEYFCVTEPLLSRFSLLCLLNRYVRYVIVPTLMVQSVVYNRTVTKSGGEHGSRGSPNTVLGTKSEHYMYHVVNISTMRYFVSGSLVLVV